MEHANSTAIGLRSAEQLPNLAAHEFFHLWNVKRIRPATLDPIDYTKEQYTRALWFAEGSDQHVCGVYDGALAIVEQRSILLDLSQQISDLEARPANRWQSAEESSLDAWLEEISAVQSAAGKRVVLREGASAWRAADSLIRDRTDNEKSLDDVLRAMNNEFAKKNKPYRDSLDVRLTAERIAGGSSRNSLASMCRTRSRCPMRTFFRSLGWN